MRKTRSPGRHGCASLRARQGPRPSHGRPNQGRFGMQWQWAPATALDLHTWPASAAAATHPSPHIGATDRERVWNPREHDNLHAPSVIAESRSVNRAGVRIQSESSLVERRIARLRCL